MQDSMPSEEVAWDIVSPRDFEASAIWNGLVVVGDTIEALSAAVTAHKNKTPVFQLHAGEKAQGHEYEDNRIRFAISQLAHVRFAPTEAAKERLDKTYEPSRNVLAGAPAYYKVPEHPSWRNDHLGVLIYHHTDRASTPQVREVVRSIGEKLGLVIRDFSSYWIPPDEFDTLMVNQTFIIGNSSAGMIEAARWGVSAINIGYRQWGREPCSERIVDTTLFTKPLLRAIEFARDMDLKPGKNPYLPFNSALVYKSILAKL